MTDQPQNEPQNETQNPTPEPQPIPRRKRSFPAYFVTHHDTGEMKLYYHDEFVELLAKQTAIDEAERAAIEAERAAGRPPLTEPDPPSAPAATESPATTPAPTPQQAESALKSFASSAAHSLPDSLAAPPPDFSRHARFCKVCAHPDRDAIEGDYIRWRSPIAIAKDYNIADRSSVYRHAHATGLDRRRRCETARIMENFLELAENFPAENFDVITRAVRVYAHLDDNGRWSEPARTNYILSGPFWPDVGPNSTGR